MTSSAVKPANIKSASQNVSNGSPNARPSKQTPKEAGNWVDKVKNILGFGPRCEHGGTKLVSGVCACRPHYVGKYCDKVECQNGGKPTFRQDRCECPEPEHIRGDFCQIVECENSGRATAAGTCECVEDWYHGRFCEHYNTPYGMVLGSMGGAVLLLLLACMLWRLIVNNRPPNREAQQRMVAARNRRRRVDRRTAAGLPIPDWRAADIGSPNSHQHLARMQRSQPLIIDPEQFALVGKPPTPPPAYDDVMGEGAGRYPSNAPGTTTTQDPPPPFTETAESPPPDLNRA